MRYSQALIPTLATESAPASAPSEGLALLHRAGFARIAGRDIQWLPLGAKLLANLAAIVHVELDAIGSVPIVSGECQDAASFCDAAAALAGRSSLTTKHLPLTMHQRVGSQIHTAVVDSSPAWAASSMARLESFVSAVASRARVRAALADCGDSHAATARVLWSAAAGKSGFQVALDPSVGYAATADVAERPPLESIEATQSEPSLSSVLTPNIRTVAEVAEHLECPLEAIIKTIIVVADGRPAALCVRGDRTLSLPLARRALNAKTLELASPEVVAEHVGCAPGFVGPIGLEIDLVADVELRNGAFICGGGEADTHLRDVVLDRDATVTSWFSLGQAIPGDLSPKTGAPYEWIWARELAKILALGAAPTLAIKGAEGVSLTAASVDLWSLAISLADDNATPTGIAWPVDIAPYPVTISVLKMSDEDCLQAGEQLYRDLTSIGEAVLLDDRVCSVAAKIRDSALTGAPVRVHIGPRVIADGAVEIIARGSEDGRAVATASAASTILDTLSQIRRKERSSWT